MRLLTERRDDLVAEHTRWINRLHVLLRDLHPGGAEVRLDTADASALLTKIRPVTRADQQRKQIARDVVRDLKRHEASIKELEKQLRAAVTASGTTLTQIQGIGFLTAAKILALTGDIRRFPNQEHYASYAGTAPIDVSSGEQETHRLSRRGNRQLNAAIHVAAVTQARDPGPGRDHYRRKIAEHKTVKEARRSLKRRISNAVYRRILADRATPPTTGRLTHRGALEPHLATVTGGTQTGREPHPNTRWAAAMRASRRTPRPSLARHRSCEKSGLLHILPAPTHRRRFRCHLSVQQSLVTPGVRRFVARMLHEKPVPSRKPASDLHVLWWAILGCLRRREIELRPQTAPVHEHYDHALSSVAEPVSTFSVASRSCRLRR